MPILTPPPFVGFIIDRLKRAGYQAYIVGGAVRDACICRPATDWDVATSAKQDQIEAVFQDVSRFSLKFGTVTLVHSGRHFEITPFRGPANHIRDDLERRDFTMNAMAYDVQNHEILDYVGGRRDLTIGWIRATCDPPARFREDPLRLLRAVRLSAEFRFQLETGTAKALSDSAPLLTQVAPERIKDELMRMLLSPRPSIAFKMMHQTGLIETFLPELVEGYLQKQNAHHRTTVFKHILETLDRVEPIPVLRLTALFHDIAKPRVKKKIHGEWRFYGHETASAAMSEQIMTRLKFSKEMIQNVAHLIRHHMIDYNPEWGDAAVRRLVRRVGGIWIRPLLTFRRADLLAHGLQELRQNKTDHADPLKRLDRLGSRIRELEKNHFPVSTRDLAVDGRKVMEILGLEQGPEVGNRLKELLEKVIDHPELNTEEGLVSLLNSMKLS